MNGLESVKTLVQFAAETGRHKPFLLHMAIYCGVPVELGGRTYYLSPKSQQRLREILTDYERKEAAFYEGAPPWLHVRLSGDDALAKVDRTAKKSPRKKVKS